MVWQLEHFSNVLLILLTTSAIPSGKDKILYDFGTYFVSLIGSETKNGGEDISVYSITTLPTSGVEDALSSEVESSEPG